MSTLYIDSQLEIDVQSFLHNEHIYSRFIPVYSFGISSFEVLMNFGK